jgi:transposase
MEYFAGLDIAMMETHICVMDRDGKVALEAKAATAIAAELAKAPTAQRIVFETGRMATTLYHGLAAFENQIRGLALVFGVRLPRGLSPAVAEQATSASSEDPALSGALRGLLVARDALLGAITAINRDIKLLARSSEACQRLMTIPGAGHLTALAFVAAIDEPDRFRSSRDVGPYLGLVRRRWKSGEIDYTGSKVGDRRVRTLLYEAANVMLTRYRGDLALKD